VGEIEAGGRASRGMTLKGSPRPPGAGLGV
jgi:hypothetical protein